MRYKISPMVLAVVVAGTMAACGSARLPKFPESGVFRECDPREEVTAQRLQASELLSLTAPSVQLGEIYVKKPCEDEDSIGMIGRPGWSNGAEEAVSAYYEERLPSAGWRLAGQHSSGPVQAGQSGFDISRRCFENPGEPGVTLEVSFTYGVGGNVPRGVEQKPDFFLEFRFNREGVSCD
ncbi:hypothetical protein [Goodfellowiella coeruleoviolacea]|uniref:hypothetical protein n=1 Tax=Goodfellowiella coeruleoviolacea TaxID=334858 RepID=UPI0020A2EEA7|nr:hypothetical protein [Goodfellowiella coeruleoviolacea]